MNIPSNLSVNLAGIPLRSPLILSSGILGVTASSLAMVARHGAGAVTTKSCCQREKAGHPGPVIIPFEGGLLNAVGLANPGVEKEVEELREYRKQSSTPVIASIFAGTIGEFKQVAAIMAEAEPDMIEVNVSCPNVKSEFGEPFSTDPKAIAEITRLVKQHAGRIPVAIKLSPNGPPIATMAKAAEDAGADAITAINTVGPGMLIDINTRKPFLANKAGGVSGIAILPIAIRCIFDIFRAVKIPIIGGGGVMTWEHALQMLLAGATTIGIGTGIYNEKLDIFRKINDGLSQFMKENTLNDLRDLIGKAHE